MMLFEAARFESVAWTLKITLYAVLIYAALC